MPPNAGYEVDICSTGSFVKDGKTIAVTSDSRMVQSKLKYDEFSGYNIPTEFQSSWLGKTVVDGVEKDVKIEMTTELKNSVAKIDILAELPYVLKVIIQTFVTAPYMFQWIEKNTTAKVSIGEDTYEIEGTLFAESCFLQNV